MALRCSPDDVRNILVDSDPDIAIDPFQTAANALVNKIEANDTNGLMSDELLAEVERWLAAGLYAIADQRFSESVTGDAEAVFQTGHNSQRGGSLEQNDYLKMAVSLDITGYLATLNQHSLKGSTRAGMTWLGKAPSGQTDFLDRD